MEIVYAAVITKGITRKGCIYNKNVVYQIQQHIKMVTHHIQVMFISEI